MCKKEKDTKDKREKKEKRAKKAQSGEAGASGAGASAAQCKCTLKLVEERKDLLSPVLSAPRRLLPPPRARLSACLPARPPAMPAHPRVRAVPASQCRFLPGCFRPSG